MALPCSEIVHGLPCGRESEYICDGAFRCLSHSHLGGCCDRMFWPEDSDEAEELGWADGEFERLFS